MTQIFVSLKEPISRRFSKWKDIKSMKKSKKSQLMEINPKQA